jgi:hypothetical protein
MSDIWFPQDKEYGDFYQGYIATLKNGNVQKVLEKQLSELPALFEALSESQWLHRYAAGKWSVKEVLGHICDTERVMAYRALRIARGDQTPLPGFEENPYVEAARFDRLSGEALIAEFKAVRISSLSLKASFADEVATHMGSASGFGVSVRALFAIIAGHTQHHFNILQERYDLFGAAPHATEGQMSC